MGTFLRAVLVSILVICFVACTGMKKDTSSSQKMLADLQQDLAQCKAENSSLSQAAEIVKKEEQTGIKRLERENLALTLQVKELQEQLDKAQLDKAKKDTAEAAAVKQPEGPATATLSPPQAAKSKDRIKVVWGNGKPASAKKLSAKVTSLGYKVDKVSSAARQNYKSNLVYYSKDAKAGGQKLARQLKAQAKPMTWKSDYSIIVVAGGK